MQKKLTILFVFAIFVLVMGVHIDTYACHKEGGSDNKDCDGGGGGGGGGGDEPIIDDCPVDLCIADVGLKGTAPNDGTGRPADLYAWEDKTNRFITNISSPKFDKILNGLPEGDAQLLCDAYHVLIFNWGSPTIKNLNWQRLLDYMDCGGGIIFEDQNNVKALATDVSTIEIDRHGGGQSPLSITLKPVPVLTEGFDEPTAEFANQHIIFAEPNVNTNNIDLTSFLSLVNGDVVGLYGEFDISDDRVFGRIVLTGPDNNYHGLLNSINETIKENHTALLENEINWVLLASCGNGMIDSHLEECDDGNTSDGDKCSAVCIIIEE